MVSGEVHPSDLTGCRRRVIRPVGDKPQYSADQLLNFKIRYIIPLLKQKYLESDVNFLFLEVAFAYSLLR